MMSFALRTHNVLPMDFVGMQNNLIACTIIVFLCIIASMVIGAISVLARMVPAALVNAFLYLTACKFYFFVSSQLSANWGVLNFLITRIIFYKASPFMMIFLY